MSEYPNLIPIFASSTMQISYQGQFRQIIIYDYQDFTLNPEDEGYYAYVHHQNNLEKEIQLYWSNLQEFLDMETNLVNDKKVKLRVQDCLLNFRSLKNPFVQWIIEFQGEFQFGRNTYENWIEPDVLEYPIFSTYIFDQGIKVIEVMTELDYVIADNQRIINYYGKQGDQLGDHEVIIFNR